MSIQSQSQLPIVLITHDLGVVARIASTVLVMYAGRVVEHGTAEQVFEEPMRPYTRDSCSQWTSTASRRAPAVRARRCGPATGRPAGWLRVPSAMSVRRACVPADRARAFARAGRRARWATSRTTRPHFLGQELPIPGRLRIEREPMQAGAKVGGDGVQGVELG